MMIKSSHVQFPYRIILGFHLNDDAVLLPDHLKWLPILMIENTKEAIGVSASIDSFRNEMVRGQQAVLRMAANGEVKEIADARDDHN